jgi:leucine dehydrogenase
VLEGAYITAEDVGTSTDDMCVIAEQSEHVSGLPPSHGGSGDPSPVTALGVEAAMRACAAHRFGSPDLAGKSVAVVGVGRVGAHLARRLDEAGAELILADIDERKRALADELGARWADPNVALLAELGILYAPDFVANAGGLVNIAVELEGYDRDRALRRAEGIGRTMAQVLRHAEKAGTTPLTAAYTLARKRLAGSPGRRSERLAAA